MTDSGSESNSFRKIQPREQYERFHHFKDSFLPIIEIPMLQRSQQYHESDPVLVSCIEVSALLITAATSS